MRHNLFLNRLVIVLIKGIRPVLGPAECRFTISCTRYAFIQLEDCYPTPFL